MMSVGDIMSTLGDIQYTAGDTMSTLGVFHDECGGYLSTVGVLSTPGDIMNTPRGFSTPRIIMSTLGGYQNACGGYHEYTGECSLHWRDNMSTPRDFGTNEKKPLSNFEDFCSRTFATMQL